MKRRIAYLCMLSLLSVFLLAGCGNKEENNNPNYDSKQYLSGVHYVMMEILDYGTIYLELDADIAPATVTNFVNLVNAGFYNDLSFHRIIDGFVMQGGDPTGLGNGGSKYTLPGEFNSNGIRNTMSHLRGTISMARATNDYNSASSQFFIVHQDCPALDGYYAAFGRVISGMYIIDSICANTIVEDENGTVLPENRPVINFAAVVDFSEVVLDEEVYENDGSFVPQIPTSEAVINFTKTDSVDGLVLEDTWNIDENGNFFVFSSSMDLLTASIYKTDLANGLSYDAENPLASTTDVGANTAIAVQLTVSDEPLPSLLLFVQDYGGGIAKYLISFDPVNGAYLIPVG